MSDKRCIIVAAGIMSEDDFPIPVGENDLLMAADAGYESLLSHGIIPDLIVGDFDSAAEPEGDFEIIRLPVEKDDTDTAYCVKEGFKRGYDRFVIYGGLTGDRLSHTIANIQLLTLIDRLKGSAELVCKNTSVFLLSSGKKRIIRAAKGDSISLFSLSDSANVSAEGLYYPLHESTLKRNFPLGVSNHLTDKETSIFVHSGDILVIVEKTRG